MHSKNGLKSGLFEFRNHHYKNKNQKGVFIYVVIKR